VQPLAGDGERPDAVVLDELVAALKRGLEEILRYVHDVWKIVPRGRFIVLRRGWCVVLTPIQPNITSFLRNLYHSQPILTPEYYFRNYMPNDRANDYLHKTA
jgi:hypothetical protein